MSWTSRVAIVSLAAAIGCARTTQSPETMKGATTAAVGAQSLPEVQVWGALRSVMHEGRTEGNVALHNILPGPHAYAVGALSGLRGEVTVLNDEVIVSLGESGGGVRTLPQPIKDETATLLVRAVVPSWTRHTIDHAIESNRFDEELENVVKSAGLAVGARIPIVIEARAQSLDWHVLSGRAPAGENAHHGPRSVGKLSGTMVTLVGFFSRNDEAVFTHMGEHSHFHVVTSGERMTGHVDSIRLEPGAVVRLPSPNQ